MGRAATGWPAADVGGVDPGADTGLGGIAEGTPWPATGADAAGLNAAGGGGAAAGRAGFVFAASFAASAAASCSTSC
jgi:hypothetical protein